ncbi:hypothetical protein [Nitrospina gracilis]|uniref:hypothetical protein n=1 Tax=Nitrospina gracilis TaxID=35801 RepID=UPI001F4382C7|nr:hypothetical protein [Nitrospina gracilis]MCF8720136.1 hypothetical protein [Nitrospina gracilis Nb-211]
MLEDKKTHKGPALRMWIRDRVVFLALMIFGFGASAYILSPQLFPAHSIWLHPVKEFSLLIAMIGVVSLGYELFLRELTFNEYKEALQEIVNPDAVRLGIQGIYKNRSELGNATSFEVLFKRVKHEIFIGGTSLLSISTGSRDLLREKVLSGVNVKLLLMDPQSPVVDLISRQAYGKSTFLNEIKTSILLLQKLQEEIESVESPAKGKFIVHTYRFIPSHSFISLDVQEPGGLIVADIGPYLGRNFQRPSIVLINKKHGLYDHYRDLNNSMWQESQPLTPSWLVGEGPKTRTQVFVSGKDTEVYDTETENWRPAEICQGSDDWRGIKGSMWVWVREQVSLEEAKTGTQHGFRLKFDIPPGTKSMPRAELFLRADDVCRVTVNDVGLKQDYGGAEYPEPFIINCDDFLREGTNEIHFEVINYAKPDSTAPEDNPSGLIYRLHLEYLEG